MMPKTAKQHGKIRNFLSKPTSVPRWPLLRLVRPAWAMLRLSWGQVGAMQGHLGASWGLLGPSGAMLGACCGLVAAQNSQNACKTELFFIIAELEARRDHAETFGHKLEPS